MMRKIFVVALFFVVLLLSGCGKLPVVPYIDDSIVETGKIKIGSVIQKESFVGYVAPVNQTVVSAQVPGRLVGVFVDRGDEVQAGQLLAQIDTDELDVAIESARKSLESLEKIYSETKKLFDKQIQAASKQVEQAKINMNSSNLSDGTVATEKLKQLQKMVETYKTQLEKTNNLLETKEKQLYENSKNALVQERVLLKNIQVFVDELFGISVEKRLYDDGFDVYLGAGVPQLKDEVVKEWRILSLKFKDLNQRIDRIVNWTGDFDSDYKQFVYDSLLFGENLLIQARDLMKKTYDVIDNSLAGVRLPLQTINNWKKIVTNFQLQIEQTLIYPQGDFLGGVKGMRQMIEDFDKQKDSQISLIRKQLESAYQQYLSAKTETKTKYEIAQQQYLQALAQFETLKAQKEAKLSEINSQIIQIKLKLQEALVNKNNSYIVAPFDGVIVKKMVEQGQYVGPGTPAFAIGSQNGYKVVVSIPTEEVTKLKKGQKAVISVLGQNINKVGIVKVISPATDEFTKKVPVEVYFNHSENIILGSIAKVFFKLGQDDGILIDRKFLNYEFDEPYTFVKNGSGKLAKVFLTLGICDEEVCVVKKGLKKGDIVAKIKY